MSAPVTPAAGASPPQNWFSEWQARTPVVSRFAILIVLPLTAICLLWTALNDALVLTPSALTGGQVWRLVTSLLDQGGFFALLFVILMLAMQGPTVERAAGSLRFLFQIVIFGIVTNLLYASVSVSFGGAR